MKFQGDILNFSDFIKLFVFTTNHHLKELNTRDCTFYNTCFNLCKTGNQLWGHSNSANPVQIPQNAAYDQDLHYSIAGMSIQSTLKNIYLKPLNLEIDSYNLKGLASPLVKKESNNIRIKSKSCTCCIIVRLN